ncbi:hypothetical protein MHI43_25940 [Paenibacillus sp. FSL H8-0457]|uniref:hypothetical protein n=1 Tax=unclassified Paenibacillus TaxID=185978 RepID=UPI0012DDDAD6|nr:hypothetical protein [Paenibacillus sp. FSL H8-457]
MGALCVVYLYRSGFSESSFMREQFMREQFMREQFMRELRRVNVGSSEYVSFLQSLLSPNFWIVCQGMKFGSKGDRSAFPESIRPLRCFDANELPGHRRRAHLPDHKGGGG